MADPNPYEPPPEAPDEKRSNVKRNAAIIVLSILLIPASGIAFFTCCLAALDSSTINPIIAGFGGTFAVFVLFVLLLYAVLRRK